MTTHCIAGRRRSSPSGVLAPDREEAPGAGDALQVLFAAVVEFETGAGDQIAHGAGREHLACALIAWAQRLARAGPSNVARNPSPVVLTTLPRPA